MGKDQSKAGETLTNPLAPRTPHFRPKVKNVIYLHMAGSPPNLDMFDYKPELTRRNGQDCPQEFLRGRRFAFTSGTPKLLGRRSGSPSMAIAAPGSPRPCRIWPACG